MNKADKDFLPLTKEQIRHYEQVITQADFTGNPLSPEFNSLLDQLLRAQHHAASADQEISRLKTQLIEMNRSLDLASRVDPLTGLANRRDILEKIEQEHSRAYRHKRTFSIILIDIDDFKLINEKYGINVGDDVLVEVACVLRECVRSEDICSRWGGEKFLFLLPETGIEGALAVAQKINTSVAMTEFKVNKPGIRTTVSLGLCNYQTGLTVLECINRAEKALIQAKNDGKNQCVVAE